MSSESITSPKSTKHVDTMISNDSDNILVPKKRANRPSDSSNASRENNMPSSLVNDDGLDLTDSHYMGCFRRIKFRSNKCQRLVMAPLTFEFWIVLCLMIDIFMIILICELVGLYALWHWFRPYTDNQEENDKIREETLDAGALALKGFWGLDGKNQPKNFKTFEPDGSINTDSYKWLSKLGNSLVTL